MTREHARAPGSDRHRHGRLRRRPRPRLAERYAPLIAGRPALISFQTVTELRCGALLPNWGAARLAKLEAKIQRAEIVHAGPDLVLVHAQLRVACRAAGHALAQREHNADRWIAATAFVSVSRS